MILDKLFNKNKNQEYFLEINDKVTTPVANQPASSVTEEAKPTPEEKVDAPTSKEKPAPEAPVATSTKSPKTNQSTSKTSNSAPANSNVSYEPPEWVKAIKDYSQPGSVVGNSATGDNFAGKYVTNNVSSSRRRPGPSLNKFKDIASKMK